MYTKNNLLSKSNLHEEFLGALQCSTIAHSDPVNVPLEIDFEPPLPSKVRLYIFNMTNPPTDRPSDEYRAHLKLPNQSREDLASFDYSDGRVELLVGYSAKSEIFVLWDAGLYNDFVYTKVVQVKGKTIFRAIAGEIAEQKRNLQTGTEVAIACNSRNLKDAVIRRCDLTVKRLSEE
jgi:hypothetical protein